MVSEETRNLANTIQYGIKQNGVNYADLSDLLDVAVNVLNDNSDTEWALKVTKYVKDCCDFGIAHGIDVLQLDALYWKALRNEAPYWFESFLYYMEKDRPDSKKFYKPRAKTLHTVVEDLQALENCEIMFYGLSLPPRVGKLLADDTPILTSDGWKTHGELKVGDRVVSPNGRYVRVQHVFQKNYADRIVTFTNGEQIQCHENHEWVVYDRAERKERIMSTKEIENRCIEYGNPNKRGHRYVFQLLKKVPMIGEHKELPVPPYTLGAWIGDGTNRKPRITICDTDIEQIVDSVVNDGYSVSHTYKQQGCTAYEFTGLKKDLQKLDLCHSRRTSMKYIPDIYFSSSKEQRLELLAGLLDTDGTLNKKEHRYHYSTIDGSLVDGIVKLISTFGWRTSVVKYDKRTSNIGIVGKHDVYTIGFNPSEEIPCRVKRKQLNKFSKYRRIAIKSIEKTEKKRGNCIQVEGGVYLAGKTMLPTHNSTICIFFLAWVMGRHPDLHNAMGGHSGILAKGFFKEALNLITSVEYKFSEIFPDVTLESKSSDEYTVNLNTPDRFATLTCRGIDGTWTGAVDISNGGYLYVDDLIRDRTESLSPIRLENRYQDYLNVMVDRKNDGAKELMVGTRWNIMDPLGKNEEKFKNNPKARFRKIPALNEKDESNFNYDYGVGFSTEYYKDIRSRLDKNEWEAKYQQRPFVREGLLFPEDSLETYNGILPDADHRVVSACDVAWGGGDSLSMPIGYEYQNGKVYIPDWIFNKGKKEVTIPIVIGKLMGEEIRQICFEANNGGDMYKKYVDEKLEEYGYKCSCSDRRAPGNLEKMSKIIAYSGTVIKNFVFLDREHRSQEYQDAMDELTMFTQLGKNIHDDAADGLTQLAMAIEGGTIGKCEAMRNPFG